MNILKQLYCNQYYELKPKGKGAAARANDTALSAIALVLYALSFSFLLKFIFPDFKDSLEILFQDIFVWRSGKAIGQIIAAISFISFYFIVKYTLGKKEYYEKTITEFESLSELQQKQLSKNGLLFFLISITIFAVVIVSIYIID